MIKDGTSFIFLNFPDPIKSESPIMEIRLDQFIKTFSEALVALKALEKWIQARKEVCCYAKSVLEVLYKTLESKEDLKSKLRLFVLPRFEYTLSAMEQDRELTSEMEKNLSVINKVTEGCRSSLDRTEAILELIGYNSRKHNSEVNKFLRAIIDEEFDNADALLEKLRTNFERLKRKLERIPRARRATV